MKRQRSEKSAQCHFLTVMTHEPDLLYRVLYWLARGDPSSLLSLTVVLEKAAKQLPFLRQLLQKDSPFHNCWCIAFINHWPNEVIRLYEYDYQIQLERPIVCPKCHGPCPCGEPQQQSLVHRLITQSIEFVYPTHRSGSSYSPLLHQAGKEHVPGNLYFSQTGATSVAKPWIFTGPLDTPLKAVSSESEWTVALCKMRRTAMLLFHEWANETAHYFKQYAVEDDQLMLRVLPNGVAEGLFEISAQANAAIFTARTYALQLEPLLNASRNAPLLAPFLWISDYLMPGRKTLKRLRELGQMATMQAYQPLQMAWWQEVTKRLMERVDVEMPYPNEDLLYQHLSSELTITQNLSQTHAFMYDPETRLVYRRLIQERDSTPVINC